MATSINTSNVSVDSSGRVKFSGLTSNIDSQAAIDGIIKAKSIPIDSLKTKITTNDKKIAAYNEFKTDLNALKESLKKLYGAVSADSANDIFEGKQTYASASRSDGSSPSSPTNLIGISVTNAATTGSHTIELVQTAASHKVGSAAMSSNTADLGTARGLAAGSISGSFTIGGKSIAVSGTDKINDLVDRINNANKGTDATGVTASIVSASAGEQYIVLTVDATGKTLGSDIAVTDPNGVLDKLGIRATNGDWTNQLQAARKAQFYADGLVDSKNWSSAVQASQNTAFGTSGTLTITDALGNAIGSIAYNAGDTMQTLRDAINADATLSGAGIGASITQGSNGYTLKVSGTNAIGGISDSGTLGPTLGLAKDPLLLERNSNTVSDLFKGVTLNLYQAEAGTTIKVDVERDLSAVKTAISGFVDAYNKVRQFTNTQLDTDPTTGKAREEAVLYGTRVIADAEAKFNQIFGAGAQGTNAAFSVLAQIGIDFVDNSSLEDPTLQNTLSLDSSKLDEVLLNNVDDVKKLFTFSFSSSDSRFSLLGFTGTTAHTSGGYQVGVTYNSGTEALTGATISGGGTTTVNGRMITVTDGAANGLKLFYNGTGDVPSAQIDFSVGIGAQMYFALDTMLDEAKGTIQSEVTGLTDANTLSNKRVDEMTNRVEMLRATLTQQYQNMETLLASLNNMKDSITQITDSWAAAAKNK